MSDNVVCIRNFDRFEDRYLLRHPDGAVEKFTGDAAAFDRRSDNYGKIKKFLLGRNVVVYVLNGVGFMRVGTRLEKLTRRCSVRQRCLGPFCVYTIACGAIRTIAFGMLTIDFAPRGVDPTYDEMDRWACDFAAFVEGIIALYCAGDAAAAHG